MEQRIDGKALKLLAKDGNATQFASCGLTTVGDQMRLKEIASEVPLEIKRYRKKPTVAEVKSPTDLNQRIYKAKRNAVTKAALQKWPGNDILIFKKDMPATKELEKLISTLEESCSFEPAGFNREGIKQHILDVFNERRRRIRNGHDFTQQDKRTIKKMKTSSSDTSSDTVSCTSSETQDEGGDTDILESGTEEELPLKSAQIIITVMFSAIKFGDVSKQQITSALKKFKVKWSTNSKEDMAVLLFKAFLENNYVIVDCENLANIARADVHKLKVF